MSLYALESDDYTPEEDDDRDTENFAPSIDYNSCAIEEMRDEIAITGSYAGLMALENYRDAIQTCYRNGGMDKNAALMAYTGLDALGGFLGAPKLASRVIPSLESYSVNVGNMTDTRYALENAITTTLSRWWKNIKAKISKWLQSIINFWQARVSSAASLSKKAEALSKKAATFENGTWKDKDSKLTVTPQIYRDISFEGGVSGDKALAGVKAMEDFVTKSRKTEGGKDAIDKIKDVIDAIDVSSKEKMEAWKPSAEGMELDAFKAKVTEGDTTVAADKKQAPGENDHLFLSSKPMMGGKTVGYMFHTEKDAADKLYVKSFAISLYDSTYPYEMKKADEKIDPWKPSQVASICLAIKSTCDQIVYAKQDVYARNKASTALTDAVNKKIEELTKLKSDAGADLHKMVSFIQGQGISVVAAVQPAESLQKLAFTSCASTFGVCVKSLNNLEKA